MKTSADIQLRMAVSQLDVERAALKRELLPYLRAMVRDIERTCTEIDADSTIHSNPMQHAASVAERIGRWNQSQLLALYLKEQS